MSRLRGASGRDVLEIGFGTGDLLYDLLRSGYRPVGIDLSRAMLQQTRRKTQRRNIAQRIPLAQARTQQLPFADQSFDAVVSTFPSEYIIDPATISEIWRVLRPAGRLVIVPAARLLPTNTTNRVLERFADIVYGNENQRQKAFAKIVQEKAFPGLTPALELAGFQILEQHWQELPASIVYVVVARKPAPADSPDL